MAIFHFFARLPESSVLHLFLALIILGASLTVLLWAGTYFFQGYIYTEPTPGLAWQAPAAAAVLTLFVTLWCLSVALSEKATPRNVPYDTLFRFSPRIEMLDKPATDLWAIRKNNVVTHYRRISSPWLGQTRYSYRDGGYDGAPWRRQGIEAVELDYEGQKIRFTPEQANEYDYRRFTSPEGWSMVEYDEGPTGLPEQFRYGRFLANILFNVGFFVVWFLVLWPILRFQWPHALGFAVVIWVAMTLAVLPMILTTAAEVAEERHQAVATAP